MTLQELQSDATPEQIAALKARAKEADMSLADFLSKHNARHDKLFHTIFYDLFGMVVGVESDGYTHT